jgi:predicted dehydrogenase
VYVEKPCSHNVREGRMLVNAARQYKRIVQHGTQARSRASTRRAIEMVHAGKIGKVLMAKAWDVQLRKDIGHQPDAPVPPGVDYPAEVTGMGRKLFFQDDQITPDTMVVTFNYPGKVLMFEMRIWNPYKMEGVDNGIAVYGSDGMMQIGRWNDGAAWKLFDRSGKVVTSSQDDKEAGGESHVKNFVDCVRSRQKPNAEIEVGHLTALHLHLGNIVARVGRALKFDAKTETFENDAEANALLGRNYRQHWGTPQEKS